MFAGRRYHGALSRPFGPSCARSTFAARRMTTDPVQAGGLFRRSMPYPREALRLSSGAAPGCLEFRFYNRRFTSRAPVETSPPETGRRAPWENPPAFTFQITCEPAIRRARGDAGPPRGHPASGSRALDGAPLASGRSTGHLRSVALARTRGRQSPEGAGRAPWPFQPSVALSSRTL